MAKEPIILVVGSINMDLAVRAPRRPDPGETILGEHFTTAPGGKGANQAVGVSRLGGSVKLIGRIGDDAFGQDLRACLRSEHIDIDNIIETTNTSSGVAVVIVDHSGENSIVLDPGANARLSPDDLYSREDCFAEADILLMQLEIPYPTARAAIDLGKRHNCEIILDPAPASNPFPEALCDVDVISPNVSEAKILTGKSAVEDRLDKLVATDLIAMGVRKAAVLKLGARGSMVVCADGHIYRVPSYKVDVVDTTAAGDAFTAGLALAIAQGKNYHVAAQFASAAGSLACTRFGAQTAMPTALEVQMLMRDQPQSGSA